MSLINTYLNDFQTDVSEQPIGKKYTEVLKQYFGYTRFRP